MIRAEKKDRLRLLKSEAVFLRVPDDVSKMAGYVGATVRHWINKGKLRAVTAQNRTLIAKDWLAEFMATDGMRIANKNKVHLRMLEKIERRE